MKTHDEIVELMHREIDGLNSADDSARLSEYLKSHPEYAHTYDELRDLSSMLNAVEDLSPRAHVSARIMKKVSELSGTRQGSRRLFDVVRSMNLRPALIFAGGLALGCLLIVSLSRYATDSSADARHLLGAFVGRNSLDEMETVGTTSLDGNGLTGTVTTKRSSNMILLNVDVHAARETTLRMTFNVNDVRFKGFVDVEHGASTAAVGTGELRYTFSGELGYAIIFDITNPETSAIEVEMMNDNHVVLARSIATAFHMANQ